MLSTGAVIDLNAKRPSHLPRYPRNAAIIRMGEGSNLDLAPPPTKPGQLLHEFARLAGLPFESRLAEVEIPKSAVDSARRLLRPEAKLHVLIHAGKSAGKKNVLNAARTVKQMFSCAVYISGTPTWKHDIPDLYFVQPSSLLELFALARACGAAVMGDARLGSLPEKLPPGALPLERFAQSEVDSASTRARLQADLQKALNRAAQ